MGAFIEGEGCDDASPSLFDDMDITFNLPYMFPGCCKITCDSFGHYGLYRLKLYIKQNDSYIIRGLSTKMTDFSQRVTELSGCSCLYVFHSDKFYLVRQYNQERNLIHKEYTSHQAPRSQTFESVGNP